MQKKTLISGGAGLHMLAVFLSVLMASSNTMEIKLVPERPRVNENVLFKVDGISERIRFSEWYRGNDTSATNQIIRYNNNDGSKNVGQRPIQRAEIFENGSLVIKNVTKDLEDKYTVFIQGNVNPYQSTVFLGVDDSNPDNPTNRGLSGGAIAGIVIGVLVVVIAAIVGGVYAFKSKDSG